MLQVDAPQVQQMSNFKTAKATLMKKQIFCLLLAGLSISAIHAQRGYVESAVRDKEYREHGAEGEDRLNGWLGNLTDVKVAHNYRFPLYMQTHIKTYKHGRLKDESDINMYLNAAKSTAGIMMYKEKRGKQIEDVFSLYDYKSNSSMIFNMKDHTYMAFNLNAFMSRENQQRRETGNARVNENIDCKKTGKVKDIQGYKCYEYVCEYESLGERHEFWIATQLPYTLSDALARTMRERNTGNLKGMNGAVLEEHDYNDGELIREMNVTVLNPNENFVFRTDDYKYNGIGQVHFYD